MQPYLLQLYGDPKAFGIAGLAAAVVGGAQIGGGLLVPHLARVFRWRTSVLLTAVVLSSVALAAITVASHFWMALGLFAVWGLAFAAIMPVRQAYVNGLIPSEHRATVLSFASLMGSSGGVAFQPALGRTADVWGYPLSYACSAALQAASIPALWLARRRRASSDTIPTTVSPS
jgi:MFS family permease